ncbi:hypothetical protein Cgig2_004530 [Carnegiea gigantea]|uniref:Uncharacterized protein n=1 Tax=Carnegiea gigantea TaxID=171969 RepID=A0A9Q1QF99_9CARY|nr:hypothetical protein Cgig2_004530 [Carnegiea gigantea]
MKLELYSSMRIKIQNVLRGFVGKVSESLGVLNMKVYYDFNPAFMLVEPLILITVYWSRTSYQNTRTEYWRNIQTKEQLQLCSLERHQIVVLIFMVLNQNQVFPIQLQYRPHVKLFKFLNKDCPNHVSAKIPCHSSQVIKPELRVQMIVFPSAINGA